MALRGTATARPRFPRVSPAREGADEDGGDKAAPRALARGDLVPESSLLELGADTELTVHSTVSTREITLIGPALAEVCPGGDEAVRLARGKVTAVPGAGVRPGAEVWIATPLGVVRFNDARMDIAVPDPGADRLEVAVISGQASVVPAAGAVADALEGRTDASSGAAPGREKGGPGSPSAGGDVIALAQGARFVVSRRAGSVSRWVGDLVASCVRHAGAAQQGAALVGSVRVGGRAPLGDLAFAHVNARQRARAACEAAWAGGALAPGLLDATRRADLEGAEATWKGTPVPPPHP
jgi:hypothetical protein